MAARWGRILGGMGTTRFAAATAGISVSAATVSSRFPAPGRDKSLAPQLPSLEKSSTVRCEGASQRSLRYGTVRLRDGRFLAYHEEGSGVPVIALHGMCSSRLTWLGQRPLEEVCPGIRLIALDRPGYGGSSAPPFGYSYTSFAQDVAELADALELPHFCVAGHSSGGPYALAAAAVLPDRVAAAAAISADAPYAHPNTPPELREADDFAKPVAMGGLYGEDPRVFAERMRASSLAKGNPVKVHAWKGGVDGFVCDWMLERVPWSFTVESIALGPRLAIWVGSEDEHKAIHISALFLQRLVMGSQLHVVEGGNHGFKSKPEHLTAILKDLAASWQH